MAVVGNRIYTQGQQGDQEFVLALDAATGKQVWKTPIGKSYSEDHGNGPRGMPQIDGNRLYAVSADGTLVASRPKPANACGASITSRSLGRRCRSGLSPNLR